MKTKLLYLPLDERPCNSFAERIMDGVGDYDFICPDKNILGNKKIPADFDAIRDFLLLNAKNSNICILSVDCLLYGGIVPSRLHYWDEDVLTRRLQTVAEMKRINPELKIYAFALIMRCPSYSCSDEEPDYYDRCGREIFLTGQIKHKLRDGILSPPQAEALLNGYTVKCADYLQDYENRRAVNLRLLFRVLDLANEYFDYLIIPQDDSSESGYTAMDREAVKAYAAKRCVKFANYPGADEVGMTLVARAVCEREKVKWKVKCVYADSSAENLVPLFEDRPLKDTVMCQLAAANCEFVEQGEDITLFLNYPADNQVCAGDNPSESYFRRDMESFCGKIAETVQSGKIAAIADGAYCNGGDTEFARILSERINLLDLSAYAGWNTSSNTLGTVICQAVAVKTFGKNAAQEKFLAERFFEDVGYCSHTRAKICAEKLPSMGLDYFNAGSVNGSAAQLVKEEILNFMKENFPQIAERYIIDCCQLPWKRMFEVDITVKRIIS